ncbi:MAG: manganese transporter, partial [Stellaceae bacterium]
LSMILTAAVLFPGLSDEAILVLLGGGGALAIVGWVATGGGRRGKPVAAAADKALRTLWRMPPLAELPPRQLSLRERVSLIVLRAYLFLAAGLVLVRIGMLAMGGA